MKKVRVERAMPGMNIGEIFILENNSMLFKIGFVTFESDKMDKLISDGWFSWVEPETLKDKFQEVFNNQRGMYPSAEAWEKAIVKILSGVAKKYYLDVFDKYCQSKDYTYSSHSIPTIPNLRKALENA
jgi:hypothetical protein